MESTDLENPYDSDRDLFSSQINEQSPKNVSSPLSDEYEYDRTWELYADAHKGLYNFESNEQYEPEPNEKETEIIELKAKVESLENENNMLKVENEKDTEILELKSKVESLKKENSMLQEKYGVLKFKLDVLVNQESSE